MTKRRIENPKVLEIFESYPTELKTKLLQLRQLIFDVASETECVGKLEETLKWGQPSYLTTETKSGSLIRIDQVRPHTDKYAIYFHCQTKLVDTFREMFRNTFTFQGNRAIIFEKDDQIPVMELRQCILLALTYHHYKKSHK